MAIERNERGNEAGHSLGKDMPIKGVTQKVYFFGGIHLECSTCGHEVEIICATKVHKQSRSTRCCNERAWHPEPISKELEDYMEDNLGASPPPIAEAYLMRKPSWIERLLQKLR